MPATIPSEARLDVNVLIASVFEDHPHHHQARAFIEDAGRIYTCPTTQGGFLRFATRPWKDEHRREQPPRLSIAEAHAKLREITDNAHHVFLSDSLAFVDVPLRSITGHRQWTDAYLLKLARQNSVALASLESRMSNLDDPVMPVLFVVSSNSGK